MVNTKKLMIVLLVLPAGLIFTGFKSSEKPYVWQSVDPKLLIAIEDGNISVVDFFVRVYPSMVNSKCFLEAYKIGEENNVKYACPIDGATPLYNAIWYDHYDIVKLLLEKGATVNVKISGVYSYAFGKTPFLLAVRQGRKEILPLLIANGANLNAKDEKGETPLCNAIGGRSWYDKTPEEKATNDANDMEIVMLLIKNGADVKKANKDGTLLHYVAARGWYEVAELLIAKGANVNARYYKGEGRIYDGYTALHFAAENGHTDIVKLLITNGANVNAKEGSGETPLCIAASKGYRNIAEFLIAKGADVNAKGLYFYTRFHSCIEAPTVLHYAVDGNNIEIVKLLIANGANVNAKAKDGITPLRLVTPNGPREIIDLLKKHGAVE